MQELITVMFVLMDGDDSSRVILRYINEQLKLELEPEVEIMFRIIKKKIISGSELG